MASIAVIIPCYNYGRFLGRALTSVLSQNLKASEMIVIDDGSTDETAVVCRRYPGVTCLSKPNGGVSSARNAGLRLTRAETIVFLDADDQLLPGSLDALACALEQAGDAADAVFGLNRVEWRQGENGGRVTSWPDPAEVEPLIERELGGSVFLLGREALIRRLLLNNIVGAGCSIIRRRALAEVGEFDEALASAEDQDFWLRVAASRRIAYVPKVLAVCEKHGSNLTDGRRWVENHLNVLKAQEKALANAQHDAKVRAMARRQIASTSEHVASRLSDIGRRREAVRLMRRSLRCAPFRWRNWARLILFMLRRDRGDVLPGT